MSANSRPFQGKVVLVTGASRGIGAAIAKAFAGEGAMVLVNYLQNAAAADEVVQACQQLGGDAWAVPADVRVPQAVTAMVAQALLEAGRIDVVVNNAFSPYAFDPEHRQRFWELPWDAFQTQFDGSVQAAYNVCQAVLPHFRQRGQGSIINMVSDLVERPTVAYNDYATAKSSLVGDRKSVV
jgi:3-oxoacyl-[acyl-carrier protein] reductase